MGITVIDVVVVAVVVISAGLAMWRGLIQETFSIFEWVGGVYVALRFAPSFQPLVSGIISPPWLAWIAVFVGTFLIVFIPLSILSHRLSELVKHSEIGPVDRADFGVLYQFGEPMAENGKRYEDDEEGADEDGNPGKPGRRNNAAHQGLKGRREAQGNVSAADPFEDREGFLDKPTPHCQHG